MPRLVAAPAGFVGAASAGEVALAVARAAVEHGWACDQLPVSDGGEGFCEALGGRSRTVRVTGPLGPPVDAEWRLLADGSAAVESAIASGLALVGGPSGNDAVLASTAGAGELVADAVKAGARRVLIGTGGSASTDGGLGAVEVLEPHSRLRGVELVVACDVSTSFPDAARAFAADKGATANQVELLERRLRRLVQVYRDRFGVDVSALAGGGAGGGLAGGLAALGAALKPGFEVVAEAIGLAERIEGADLVVTGEGVLDEESFDGKAVGGVVALARELDVPVLVVAGDAVGDHPVEHHTLLERFGPVVARADTAGCVTAVVGEALRRRAS